MNDPWGNNSGSGNSGWGSGGEQQAHTGSRKMPGASTNIIATAVAVVYIVLYLFLPFVKVASIVPLSGYRLMASFNAVYCLPLVLGLLMVLASLFMSKIVQFVIGLIGAIVPLILGLCGNSIISSSNALVDFAGSLITKYVGVNFINMIPIDLGLGTWLSLLFGIVYVVVAWMVDINLFGSSKQQTSNPWPDR